MNYFNEMCKIIGDMIDMCPTVKVISEIYIFKNMMKILGEEKFNQKFYHYFIDNDDVFDGCFFDFHKSMRQVDFYDKENGHLDMVLWHFCYISKIPEMILKQVQYKYNNTETIIEF